MSIKISTTLTNENYYNDQNYLSSSRLASFVSYDRNGRPQYNFPMFLSAPKAEGKALTIGSLVDAVLTEGKNIDELVSQKLSKEDLINLCDERGLEYEKTKTGTPSSKNTMATYKDLLEKDGYKFGEEVSKEIYETSKYIIERANEVHYDANTLFIEYIEECEPGQIILTDDTNYVKGKLDLLNMKRKRYTDLKTTGNMERVLFRELIFDGYINPYHKYVRQLAIYQELIRQATGEVYEMELAIFDYNGQYKLVRISQDALDFASKLNADAMKVLVDYVEGTIEDYHTTLGLHPNINQVGNALVDIIGDEDAEEDEDYEEITEI